MCIRDRLCASPEAARPMFAGAGPRRFTFSTITQEDAFMQELEKTRLRGYATDLEECNNGCNCLAVPVKSPAGEVLAAISVSGPVSYTHLCPWSSRCR